MINLLDFYKKNITKDDYYYKFYEDIVTKPEEANKALNDFLGVNDDVSSNDIFEIFDEEDAIKKFRDLCEPNLSFYNNENTILFLLVSYFLNKSNYVIKEFPRILQRTPINITYFTINYIRNRAFELKLDDNGTVRYQTRRKIIADLHIEKKADTNITEDLNLKFQEISTRSARFENMSTDEKIREILNMIEYLLKDNGKYVKLDYEKITLNTINEQLIIDFKKQIQCFRHASEESIKERKSFTDDQKKFIIDYGIMLCNLIYYNK